MFSWRIYSYHDVQINYWKSQNSTVGFVDENMKNEDRDEKKEVHLQFREEDKPPGLFVACSLVCLKAPPFLSVNYYDVVLFPIRRATTNLGL